MGRALTGECLHAFGKILLGHGHSDVVHVLLQLCLPRLSGNGAQNEKNLLMISNTMVLRGAASVWRRLHSQTQEFLLKLFTLVDPSLTDEGAHALAGRLSAALVVECEYHLDPFTKKFIKTYGSTPQNLLNSRPLLKAIGTKAKLGIFQAECMHADVRGSLGKKGATKSLSTASTELVLNRWHTHHVQRFGFKSVQDFWHRKLFTGSKKSTWHVKRTIAKVRKGIARTNGWNLFRRERIAAIKNANPGVRRVVGVPHWEREISLAWNALALEERRLLSSQSKIQNSLAKMARPAVAHDEPGHGPPGLAVAIADRIDMGPWATGDVSDPTTPFTASQLADARAKFHVNKTTATVKLRDQHKLVVAPDGLEQFMDDIIRRKSPPYCCQTLGICKREHQLLHHHAYGHVLLMHRRMQQALQGMIQDPTSLKYKSVLLSFQARPSRQGSGCFKTVVALKV